MKKHKITALAITFLLLFSGCSQQSSETKTENTKVSDIQSGKSDSKEFLSTTGKVVSISEKSITIEYDGKEYKFNLKDDTVTYGGKIGISDMVTVTYEGKKYRKGISAKIIALLSEEITATTVEITSEYEEETDISSETDITTVDITETEPESEINLNDYPTVEIDEDIITEKTNPIITTTIAVTTTTQDNTLVILAIQEQIRLCQQQIDVCEWGISENEKTVSKLEKLRKELESGLKNAEINLSNAQKKTIYVFDGNAFKHVPDEGAIAKAQEEVDTYVDLISECYAGIEEAKQYISKYEVEIDSYKSQIIVYQAEIADLS